MNKIKAVFFDFDWTIFDHKTHSFIDSTIEAVKQLKKNNIKVFINSARSYYSLKGLQTFNKFDFDGYVTSNGGCCFLKNVDFYVNHFERNTAKELISILELNKLSYMISTKLCSYLKVYDEEIVNDFYKNFYEPKPLNISEYKNEEIVCIQVFSLEETDVLFNNIKNIVLNRFAKNNIEITPKRFTKDDGIKSLIEHLNLKKDELMAFGDDLNDIDMFNMVKYSICLGNGKEEAKKHAFYVTDNIENDGVYKALKHFDVI